MSQLFSFDFIYLIPLIASSIYSIRSFKLKWSLAFRLFSAFLIVTVIIEIFAISWKWGLSRTSYWTYSPSNLWIYDAFLSIRHLFILLFLYELIKSSYTKLAIKCSIPPFLVFALINYFIIQTPHNVNTYTIVVANTTTIILVLIFFNQVLNEKEVVKLSSSTEIWIALGTFVYYSGTLPFFIFFNYLLKSNSAAMLSYLYINDFLNIVMYTFYLIAFLCRPQFPM
jgi:hypothetical protein